MSIYLFAISHNCRPVLNLHHSDLASFKGKALPVPLENLHFLLLSCLPDTEMQHGFLCSHLFLLQQQQQPATALTFSINTTQSPGG